MRPPPCVEHGGSYRDTWPAVMFERRLVMTLAGPPNSIAVLPIRADGIGPHSPGHDDARKVGPTLAIDFVGSSRSGSAPLAVQFSDASTPAGVADEWRWTFGDGSTGPVLSQVEGLTTGGGTSALQNPGHIYDEAGDPLRGQRRARQARRSVPSTSPRCPRWSLAAPPTA
jgi:hypothetical protein